MAFIDGSARTATELPSDGFGRAVGGRVLRAFSRRASSSRQLLGRSLWQAAGLLLGGWFIRVGIDRLRVSRKYLPVA
jgi:hypothetical protein